MKKQKAKQNKIQTKNGHSFGGKFVLSQLVVSGLNGQKKRTTNVRLPKTKIRKFDTFTNGLKNIFRTVYLYM